MKTLFCADLHLESGRDLGYGDFGPGSRFDDQVAVLERVADLAIAEECGVVAVVGDVFHHAVPKPWSILAFQEFVGRLEENKIAALVIPGNHDMKGAGLPTALDLFGGRNVAYYHRPGIWPFNGVAYACLPWTPMSTLIANEGRNTETRERAIDLLVQTIQQLRIKCETDHPDATPILLAHWSVSGSSLPNGLPVDQLSEPVIPWFDIDALDWGLVALGHIHRAGLFPDGFGASTRMFYCGSPAVVNLGELAVDHGVWIYDHEADGLAFHAIEDRPFVDWEAEAEEVNGLVSLRPTTTIPEGSIVRLRYRRNGHHINEAEWRDMLMRAGPAHRVFIKEIDKPQINRARIETPNNETISNAEALSLYIQANKNGHTATFLDALNAKHHHYIEKAKP